MDMNEYQKELQKYSTSYLGLVMCSMIYFQTSCSPTSLLYLQCKKEKIRLHNNMFAMIYKTISLIQTQFVQNLDNASIYSSCSAAVINCTINVLLVKSSVNPVMIDIPHVPPPECSKVPSNQIYMKNHVLM